MKVIALFVEVFSWIKIVLSPTLAAAILAGIIVYNKQDETGIAIGVSVISAGFIIGVVWAVYIWRKYGTTNFLSRISASPERNK
jgi:hypothetical protein